MESVPVPAEAYTKIYDTISVIDNYSPYLGAEVAAPYIDRAARIDELREWAKSFRISPDMEWTGEQIAVLFDGSIETLEGQGDGRV